jgi:hypothetical protein
LSLRREGSIVDRKVRVSRAWDKGKLIGYWQRLCLGWEGSTIKGMMGLVAVVIQGSVLAAVDMGSLSGDCSQVCPPIVVAIID